MASALAEGADMEAAMSVQNPQPPAESKSGPGCLGTLMRLAWIFGAFSLIFCAMFIIQHKGAVADLLMLLLALGLILVRFVDIKYLKGETADNKPATLKDWRRYALKVLAATGLLYALAKFLAQKNLF
ncbi:MAG: hypothetical protein ABFD80_01020 [Acidobacteriota bacterium]